MTKVNVKKLTNHIAVALDSSGSMSSIKEGAVKAFNNLLSEIQKQAKATGQKTTMTLVIFGDPDVRFEFVKEDVANVEPMKMSDFHPNNGTPLWDAVGKTIQKLQDFDGAGSKNTSFIVYTITDGYNTSSRFTPEQLRSLINKVQGTDRWTVLFQVPKGHKNDLVNVLGVSDGNVEEWETTSRGAERAGVSTSSGITRFYNSRAAGKTSTKSFYTADTADISKADVKKLVDISTQVKIWKVDREAPIKDFVLAKNRGDWTNGAAYYQLSKDEKSIQSYKQVLLVEKKSGKVLAGDEARKLIGLPASASGKDVKVKIDNRGDYDIFVQSTSTNRKLVRGTQLIYRLDHTTPSQPTWQA